MRALRRLRERIDLNFGIGLFSILLIALLWSFVISEQAHERNELVAVAVKQNSNLAVAYEEHIVRTLKGFDSALLFMRHEYRRVGRRIDIPGYIREGVVDGQLFSILSIVDEHGALVVSSKPFEPVNYADRDFFRVHRDNPDTDAFFISKPVLGRVSGTWQVPMSRRISKPDGSFGGVAVLSVDPGYFARFYQKSDIGALGVVMLVGLDGVARARRVGNTLGFGIEMSDSSLLREQARRAHGEYRSRGGFDEVRRLVSYRTLPGYPLVVAVGAAESEVLADFTNNRDRDYGMALLLSVVIGLFAWMLMVTLARQRRARIALANSEARFRGAFDQAAIGMVHISLDRRYIEVNQRFCDMLGYKREEIIGRPASEFTHPDDREVDSDYRRRLLAGVEASLSAEKRYRRRDGGLIWVNRTVSLVRDPEGQPLYFLRLVEDITERKRLEAELRALASTDMLTGLPNRRAFIARLEEEHARIRRFPQQRAAVLMLDIDYFKKVNDTHGHLAGDAVLREVATLIRKGIREVDACGRLGGEEFAVLLTGAALPAAADFAERLRRGVADAAIVHEGVEVRVTVSIGIAVLSAEDECADAALLRADRALYRAKEAGRDRIGTDAGCAGS